MTRYGDGWGIYIYTPVYWISLSDRHSGRGFSYHHHSRELRYLVSYDIPVGCYDNESCGSTGSSAVDWYLSGD